MGREMLRRAQHDSVITHTNAWINLFIRIIDPRWISRYPDEKVKSHNRVPTHRAKRVDVSR